jgi:hypothetical protein
MKKTATIAPRRFVLVAKMFGLDLIALSILLVLLARLTVGIDAARDLPTGDEGLYLNNAANVFNSFKRGGPVWWPPADWAPLYAGWGALIRLVSSDAAQLFDRNWIVLVGGNTFALYTLARRIGQSVLYATLTAGALLATNFFHMQPFPSLLYLLVLLFGAVVATWVPTHWGSAERACVIACSFGIATFVRPEAALSCLLAGLLALAALTRALRVNPVGGRFRQALRVAVLLAPIGTLFFCFGYPLGGTRAFEAFAQHYAFTEEAWHTTNAAPWLNFMSAIRHDFGDAATVSQALRRNPSAFFSHNLHNVAALPGNLLDLCALRTSIGSQASVPWLAVSAVILAFVAAGSLVALVQFRTHTSGARVAASFFVLSIIAAAPGVLIVFPRAHYLVAPCTFAWLLSLVWVERKLEKLAFAKRFGRYEFVGLMIAAALLFLLVPSARANPSAAMPKRRLVFALAKMRLENAPTLELGSGFMAFAGYDFPLIDGWSKDAPLPVLLKQRNIGIVVLERALLVREAFANDADLPRFIETPERYGFCSVYQDPMFASVFVRQDLGTTCSTLSQGPL